MSTPTETTAKGDAQVLRPIVLQSPPRWMRWAPYVAATWCAAYLVQGVLWMNGRGNYPWSRDPGDTGGVNLLAGLEQRSVAGLVIGTAVAGLVVLGTMAGLARRPGRGLGLLRLSAASAAVMGFVMAMVVPDFRILATTAYLPIIIVMTIFGAGTGEMWGAFLSWPLVNLMILTVAGAAFLATALSQWRLAAIACQRCGRSDRDRRWTTPESAALWGRWATSVAVAIPVGYATTRIAWALGIPLGVSQRLLDELGDLRYAGAALGLLGLGGAALTVGLVRPWGEIFPRWVPRLKGRQVPVGVAVIPALIVSFIVMSAGLMFIRLRLTGGIADAFPGEITDIAAWLPEMFWPAWSLSLAAAAYAYWLRRRARCMTCGQGGNV